NTTHAKHTRKNKKVLQNLKKVNVTIFCGENAGQLHSVSTFEMDSKSLFHKTRDENDNDVKYMSDKVKQVHDTRGDSELAPVFILSELKK
ncbi:hypothetical protein MAR_033576, partial [Mya arenaria]